MAFCIGSIQNATFLFPIQNESVFYRTGGNPISGAIQAKGWCINLHDNTDAKWHVSSKPLHHGLEMLNWKLLAKMCGEQAHHQLIPLSTNHIEHLKIKELLHTYYLVMITELVCQDIPSSREKTQNQNKGVKFCPCKDWYQHKKWKGTVTPLFFK